MATPLRKIVHVDMDAFYASVEQRDAPELRGRPVIVSGGGARSVVCAASYEARVFGVHSAMPALRAARLCPDGVFVAPDFARYKKVSAGIRAIFARHADRVEPLSLDEAYLDVTNPRSTVQTATEAARIIRDQIRNETGLTASAGIAPNKFLAKIASDYRKPDGQFVVTPRHIDRFLLPMDIAHIPGVGPKTRDRLVCLGVQTVADLRTIERADLQERFGRWGQRLYELARGIDERPVQTHRPAAQVSSEDTLPEDLPLAALTPHIQRLAGKAWAQHERKRPRVARTVVLKLKTADFQIFTRSYTPPARPSSAEDVADIASALRERVDHPDTTRYRLVGVGLSGFMDGADQIVQHSLW